MGGSFLYLLGTSQGRGAASMPEVGLRCLSQGSQIRTQSRGGSGRVKTEFQKRKLRFVGG